MSLLNARPFYKPFSYPWAYEAWLIQQRLHWLPEEVPLADDVKDWHHKLTYEEQQLLTHIFKFFTQSDIGVNDCYMQKYGTIFQPVEVKMMLSAFSNIETVHIAAYAYLLDTIGMPEDTYSLFLQYKEMSDKWDFMQQFNTDSPFDIAMTLAMFGAFTEGLQLFASFVILLNFPRFNKMKGMGQIVTWSVRDETLHVQSIIRLFHTFVEEHPGLWDEKLRNGISECCRHVVQLEDAFIDLAFSSGAVHGLTAEEVKSYIRYIANRRLTQLKLPTLFDIHTNPLPWVDAILNGVEHTNFFENRATEYTKTATQGTWDEAFMTG